MMIQYIYISVIYAHTCIQCTRMSVGMSVVRIVRLLASPGKMHQLKFGSAVNLIVFANETRIEFKKITYTT